MELADSKSKLVRGQGWKVICNRMGVNVRKDTAFFATEKILAILKQLSYL